MLALCFTAAACSELTAMMNYVLFSPLSGTVYLNGIVVPNAHVERRYKWVWGEKSDTDETTTNKQGRFSMPEISTRSMSAWFPHEPIVEQDIDVFVDAQKYQVWGGKRSNYRLNGEFDDKPIKIRIELTAKVTQQGRTMGRFTFEP